MLACGTSTPGFTHGNSASRTRPFHSNLGSAEIPRTFLEWDILHVSSGQVVVSPTSADSGDLVPDQGENVKAGMEAGLDGKERTPGEAEPVVILMDSTPPEAPDVGKVFSVGKAEPTKSQKQPDQVKNSG